MTTNRMKRALLEAGFTDEELALDTAARIASLYRALQYVS